MSEPRTKTLFQDAVDLTGIERAAFLERECCGDSALRQRVERLLAAHDTADDFLERPATWMAGVDLTPDGAAELAGDVIGGFELIDKLGEGGFGTVWRARQDSPVRREVALKIIKLGMDTAEVVARFEHERESLARLDHPNVAKVLEAGATADGRPWFAMELVDGEPITDYCDAKRLDVRARLALFVRVCRAVQHAHHNGIVHRDVKPSNVLVSTRDGEPLPRIIDFGIAKAIHRSEAELTMFTQERRLLGTPEYMSPEQVDTWGADVDARTDVYSLGVLLYELLTGSRPFAARRGGPSAHAEILRRITEEDPERPSARLAQLPGADADALAGVRRTTRGQLVREVAGELDWIVLRALEKDRERRYATPAELAADVERHLRDEVVAAGPPSAAYRFRKFARRHRVFLTAASIVVTALVAGTAFALHGFVEARRAEAAARAEADKAGQALDAVEELLASADPRFRHGPDYRVRDMLDDFAVRLSDRELADAEVEARVRTVLGRTYRQLGELDRAREHVEEALRLRREELGEEHPLVQESRLDHAWVLHDAAQFTEALAVVEKVVDYWRQREGAVRELGTALDARANLLAQLGQFEPALADLEEASRLCIEAMGEDHPDVARVRSRMAQLLFMSGRAADAESVMREALAGLEGHVPDDHPEVLTLRHNLAVLLDELGRWSEAEPLHRAVLDARVELHGENHPSVASSHMNLGWLNYHLGRYEEAERHLRRSLEGQRAARGEDHPFVTEGVNRLGVVLQRLGRLEEAEEMLRDAVRRNRELPGHRADSLVTTMTNLAILLRERGDAAAAEEQLRAALEVARRELPDPHPSAVATMIALARVLESKGDVDEAERLLAESIRGGEALWDEGHPLVREPRTRLDELRRAREASFSTGGEDGTDQPR